MKYAFAIDCKSQEVESVNQQGRTEHVSANSLPCSYKEAPYLWRHSLHSICSRVAMFPPQLVHYFIQKYTEPGDVVADLWAGVGTTPLQGCLTGRVGIGNDISPEAYVVMRAKLDPPRLYELMEYLGQLRSRIIPYCTVAPDKLGLELGVREYYHPNVLKELLGIRRVLRNDAEKEGRKGRLAIFVQALMLGILHGDRPESISLPLDSAKATSLRHIAAKQKASPAKYAARYKNVVDSLFFKAAKVFRDYVPEYSGRALNFEALKARLGLKAQLFVTSPPYLDVHTYAYDNRIRLWYLGIDYRTLRNKLFNTGSVTSYLTYVITGLKRMEEMLETNGACVLVIGDVKRDYEKPRTLMLGELVARQWLDTENEKMRLTRVVVDRIEVRRKRYFNLRNQDGIKTERILEFRKSRSIMREPRINWSRNNGGG